VKTLEKPAGKYNGLFGVCRREGFCVEDCGLCAYIKPQQTPNYKATNQAYRYKKKKDDGVLLSPDTEGKQIGYKEPLRPVEDGFGYYGTITVNLPETHVQCHKCGFYFKLLGQHIREHNLTGRDYKKDFGLSMNTLMTQSATRDWSSKRPFNQTPEHKEQVEKARQKALLAIQSSDKIGKAGLPLEYYNKFGLCPDQIVDKYLKLKDKLGKDPSIREVAKEYTWGVANLLKKSFGNWDEVKEELGGA
jgi:hypothetical protein